MTEIDPQAVFISDEGEVRYLPQYAGKERVIEFRPPLARLGEPVLCDDIRQYDVHFAALPARSPRTQKAICRLLQERDAEAALVDRCYKVMQTLLGCSSHRALSELSDDDWDLEKILYRRQVAKERQR